jgi:hypothetical protein
MDMALPNQIAEQLRGVSIPVGDVCGKAEMVRAGGKHAASPVLPDQEKLRDHLLAGVVAW